MTRMNGISEMDAELAKKLTVDDQPPAPEREYGSVIFFHPDPNKNYGFIRSENTIGADLWFHQSFVEDRQPLRTAQRVSYVVSVDHRGRMRAQDIKIEVE